MPAWDPKFASRSKLCCFFGQTIPLEGEQKERPSAAAVAAPAAAAALINGKLTFPLLRKRASERASERRQRGGSANVNCWQRLPPPPLVTRYVSVERAAAARAVHVHGRYCRVGQ